MTHSLHLRQLNTLKSSKILILTNILLLNAFFFLHVIFKYLQYLSPQNIFKKCCLKYNKPSTAITLKLWWQYSLSIKQIWSVLKDISFSALLYSHIKKKTVIFNPPQICEIPVLSPVITHYITYTKTSTQHIIIPFTLSLTHSKI